MTVAVFILSGILLLSNGINGRRRFRTPCLGGQYFRCDDGNCVGKQYWCDGSTSCDDNSDELYCRLPWYRSEYEDCDDNIHFRCNDGTMCIPREGYCDGYSSCPDRSDEMGCPCEDLNEEEGNIEYEAFIDAYRTQHKCWKIAVTGNQYVQLEIKGTLSPRPCKNGNVTVFPATVDDDEEKMYHPTHLICPTATDPFYVDSSNVRFKSRLRENTLIRYRSNFYIPKQDRGLRDFLSITYRKVDVECENPDAFRCAENSCISSEKHCDGTEDCQDGRDEQNCDISTFFASYLQTSRNKAAEWMQKQHNADWGWKDSTPKAVVALHLAESLNVSGSKQEDDLIAKQLELEVSTFLFRNKIERSSIPEISAYINALLVICHDPRNFYGVDLVTALRDELESVPEYTPPFPYLTLCNAKEPVPEDAVNQLLKLVEESQDHGFVLEIQSLTIMAITCAINNNNQYAHLKQNVTEALDNLKKEQMPDGSFGNEYTTAMILQALIANNQGNAKDWNPKSAIKFLQEKQEASGSFDDFLTTYLVLPVLNGKSLLDVGKTNCTKDLKRPRSGDLISDIKNRLGGKVVVKYSLFIGDEKDQIHPIVLRTHENITVYELMTLAADIDPKYKFKTHQIKEKMYIYEISNIPNDSESNKFWFMYEGVENGTTLISEQSPNKVNVNKKKNIIMWFKTLNFAQSMKKTSAPEFD